MSQAGTAGEAGPNRPVAAGPEDDPTLSWDLILDERAPCRDIMMRFANYEAAHTVLTLAGFVPITDPADAPGRPDGRTVVRYAHADGSAVVLMHQAAERLGVAAVGG